MENIDIWQNVLPAVIIIFSFITGLIIKKTILGRLSRLAKKSKAKLDDVFIETLKSVIVLWFVLLGIYISILILPLSVKYMELLEKVFQALLI
ncbi:MAG: hypothetical protein GY950_03390, partial [bacterium]|nr:hypothetical protein [bacterium]